ncbi:MAG: hypothetical protein FD156_1123 [Nitrospirae bacterium]|nr:MAG: hypothetical protein FD156_1123 [Nitrospirota bacterium]
MSKQIISSLLLPMPDDFPVAPYEIIHSRYSQRKDSNLMLWKQCAGAWNAVAYRFLSCTEHDLNYTQYVRQGSADPSHANVYLQERELFGFFITGLAAIESFYYGIFAIASMIKNVDFPFTTATDFQKVKPIRTAEKFQSSFKHEDIANILQQVINTPEFTEWNEIRNILVHRILPNRHYYLGGDKHNQTLWEKGIVIDINTTSTRRKWLAKKLNDLLTSAASFTDKYLQ